MEMEMDGTDWLIAIPLVVLCGFVLYGLAAGIFQTEELQVAVVVDAFAAPDTPGGQIAVRIDDEVFTISTTNGAAALLEVGQEIIITVHKNLFDNVYLREF